MKKVLILNQGYTNNYGDVAINAVISKFLKNNQYNVDYNCFFSEKEILGKNYYKYPKILKYILWNSKLLMDIFNKKNISKILKNKNYNLILIGGGELLSNHNGFNSSMYLWTKIAKNKNIPVIVYGVSGDTDMSTRNLNRYKKALKLVKKIFVRDEYSKCICKDVYDVESICVPDCVFAYKKLFDENYFTDSNNKLIVIVPIFYYKAIKDSLNLKNEKEYINYLKKIIHDQELNNQDILITCTDKCDEDICIKLYNDMLKDNRFKNNKILIEGFTNLDDYIKIIKKARIVISGRMHSMILGKIYGAKILPIKFKKKLEVFDKEYTNNSDIESIENKAVKGLNKILDCIK